MTDAKGQVTETAAEVYERFFVPALFAPWPARLAELVPASERGAWLDVACGTGVLAREVRRRCPAAEVCGLDRNEGMLQVARRTEPRVDWTLGQAERLPYDDARFDAVLSQFGLMFFDDRRRALTEMWRVRKPGGQLVVDPPRHRVRGFANQHGPRCGESPGIANRRAPATKNHCSGSIGKQRIGDDLIGIPAVAIMQAAKLHTANQDNGIRFRVD
jgi:SAM-dependent methyltransferase